MHLRTLKPISLVTIITVLVAGCADNQPVTGPQHSSLVAPARVLTHAATVVNENEIRLAWVAGDGNATSFEIEREEQHNPDIWTAVATVPGSDSTYNDTNVSPLPVYQYRIRACNGVDCSRWRLARRVSSASIPAAPTNVETFDGGLSTRHVQWTDNSSNENTFEIQRMSSAALDVWVDLPDAAMNATAIVDNGFPQFDNYVYRVRACHYFVGCSAWGYSATTDAVDVSITNATATRDGPNEIDLFWATGANTGMHLIYRRTLPTGAWQSIGSTPGNTFTDASAASGGFYEYRIRMCYLTVCASATATASVRPDTPNGLASPSSTSTSVDLTWFGVANETRFELQRRLRQPGFPWTGWALVASPLEDETAYTDITGITAGVQYQYRLRACNPIGCSPYSTTVLVTPL